MGTHFIVFPITPPHKTTPHLNTTTINYLKIPNNDKLLKSIINLL